MKCSIKWYQILRHDIWRIDNSLYQTKNCKYHAVFRQTIIWVKSDDDRCINNETESSSHLNPAATSFCVMNFTIGRDSAVSGCVGAAVDVAAVPTDSVWIVRDTGMDDKISIPYKVKMQGWEIVKCKSQFAWCSKVCDIVSWSARVCCASEGVMSMYAKQDYRELTPSYDSYASRISSDHFI